MYTYIAGVSAMGIAVGIFVGLSHSPVVGILLPLLFAFLTGGSGLYVVLSGDSAKARLLGGSLVAFAFTVIVASILTANYRVSGSVFGATDKKSWIMKDLPLQAQIDLFEVSLAFQFLGIPEQERDIFFKRVKSDAAEFRSELNAATVLLNDAVEALLESTDQNGETLKVTRVSLGQTRERLSRLSALLLSHVAIPTNLIKESRDLTCTLPINPQDETHLVRLREQLDAFFVACARLKHIAESHPSNIVADLNNRLKKIGNNWPESRLSTEKPPLYFENR